jgi:hypothetical protein
MRHLRRRRPRSPFAHPFPPLVTGVLAVHLVCHRGAGSGRDGRQQGTAAWRNFDIDAARAEGLTYGRKLTHGVEPAGRPGVELVTPDDATRVMDNMCPFRQAWPHWDFAAELVLKAAAAGKRADIAAATEQMERALVGCDAEGWSPDIQGHC